MKTTTNLVDDAIAIVMSNSQTIAQERRAVSDQLHASEFYHDLVQSLLEELAVGLADNEFLEILCGVITEAIFLGKKIEQLAAARAK